MGRSFHGRGIFFNMKFFFRMYLPLVLEVSRLFIDCLGLMSVDAIKKHLFVLTHAVNKHTLTLALISALTHRVRQDRNEGLREYTCI